MRASDPSRMYKVIPLVILLTLLSWGNALWAAPQKIALFPFNMNSAQDLNYLQNGMYTMLSARLSDPGKVAVINRADLEKAVKKAADDGLPVSPMTEDTARMIGLTIGADYVVFGSITVIAQSVSLDISLADTVGAAPAYTFSNQSDVLGDIIAMANNFAVSANQDVFNRSVAAKIRPISSGGGTVVATGGAAAVIPKTKSISQNQEAGFVTLGQFKEVIASMTAGDFKNNGTVQVATASNNTISILSLGSSGLVKEDTLTYPSHIDIVGLDSGDINGNGYPEIFVSAMTVHKDSLASFVIEFNGSSYQVLTENENLYYKVLKDNKGGIMLLGQRKGMDPFGGKIYTMTAKGRGYAEERRIAMPRGTSVLALDRGAIRASGQAEFLSVNRHDKLVVVSPTGSDAWKSNLRYGGTNKVWLMEREDEDESYRERIYFHPRIKFLGTPDEQGGQRAVVIKNEELMGGVVGRYKKFTQGYLEIMSWNGMEMSSIYKTEPVQGWISDFAVTDLDSDGKEELVAVVVGRSKFSILSVDKSSTIISYAME
ncbi:MAG: hypothetical protein MI802_02800 [Desulfobacterales bacterium]|nr:hypothetical protein [Desulfobacterales bacterium]